MSLITMHFNNLDFKSLKLYLLMFLLDIFNYCATTYGVESSYIK